MMTKYDRIFSKFLYHFFDCGLLNTSYLAISIWTVAQSTTISVGNEYCSYIVGVMFVVGLDDKCIEEVETYNK